MESCKAKRDLLRNCLRDYVPYLLFCQLDAHSAAGILSYVGIFVAIFLAAWVTQYSVWKRKIKKMNEGIKDNNDMN